MSTISKVVEDRYRDLACLAYLVSDDGSLDEQQLAAEAHRALWEAVPRRLRRAGRQTAGPDEIYAELRRRLLVRLIKGHQHDGRLATWWRAATGPRLPQWLRLTAPVPWRQGGGGSQLTRRTTAGRIALALAVVDGLSPAQVREVLASAGVDLDDLYPAPRAADTTVSGADELRPAVAGFDAALLRTGPGWLTRARRRQRTLLVTGAAVAVVAVCIAGVTSVNGVGAGPVVTGPTAWKHATLGDGVSDWPARGNLIGDRSLLHAAAVAFSGLVQSEPQNVQVLYAGTLAGTGPVVVLEGYDQVRDEGVVASYQPGADASLRQIGSFSATSDNTAPELVPLPGDRLLVPPWSTNLRFAWFGGEGTSLRWQPMPVRNGIATIPQASRAVVEHCSSVVAAVRYDDDSFGRRLRFTGTALVAPQLGYQPAWPTAVEANAGGENVPLLALQELADVICGPAAPGVEWLYSGASQLAVQDLGQGTLPGPGGAAVAAVNVDVQDASGRTPILAQAPLDGTTTEFVDLATGQTVATGPGANPPQASGAWWFGSGHWYLLAAGEPDLRAFGASGALGIVAKSGSFTTFSPGDGTPAKVGPVLVEFPTKDGPDGAVAVTSNGS